MTLGTPNGLSETEDHGYLRSADLNEPKFLDFLSSYPDAETFDAHQESAELEKRFGAFQTKEGVVEDLKKLYREKFEPESGVKLTNDDLESVNEYVQKQAIENPGSVIELQRKLMDFKEVPAEIESLEGEITELGGFELNRRELLDKMDVLSRAQMAGWLTRSVTFSGGKIKRKDFVSEMQKIGEQMKSLDQSEDAINGLKQQSEQIRKELFEELEPLGAIKNVLLAKIQDKFTKIVSGDDTTLKHLEVAKEEYQRLQTIDPEGNKYLDKGYFNEDFNQEFNKAIEEKTSQELMQIIEKDKKGNNRFNKLKEALGKFTSKDAIGSNAGKDVTVFVLSELKNIRDRLGSDKDAKQKKILINAYLSEMDPLRKDIDRPATDEVSPFAKAA